MIRLYLDSAFESVSAAVKQNDKILGKETLVASREGSKVMIPMLDKIYKENNIKILETEEIYVTVGPGSYTGLRIALTIAKTLGTIIPNVKIYEVSTLLASGYSIADKFVSVYSCRNGNVYFGAYDGQKEIVGDKKTTEEEVKLFIEKNKEFKVIGKDELLNSIIIAPRTIDGLISLTGKLTPIDDNLKLRPRYFNEISL